LHLADTRLWWIEAGAGSPLLLLHGYGGTARWWVRNVRALAQGRRVYIPDVPGFGRSAMRARFTLDGAVDRLVAWMATIGIERADVLGHSMGGMVALMLAARFPARVRAQVLCAPAGIPFTTGLPGIAWQAFRSRGGGDHRFTPIVVTGSLRTGPRVMWQAVQQIRGLDIRTVLHAINVPTLLLWGDRDRLLPVGGARLIADAIPDARLMVVRGAGHNLMYEHAELVNAAARDFFTTFSTDTDMCAGAAAGHPAAGLHASGQWAAVGDGHSTIDGDVLK
jgi:pimeloyl-ACP methyl ester carboxylesterase